MIGSGCVTMMLAGGNETLLLGRGGELFGDIVG